MTGNLVRHGCRPAFRCIMDGSCHYRPEETIVPMSKCRPIDHVPVTRACRAECLPATRRQRPMGLLWISLLVLTVGLFQPSPAPLFAAEAADAPATAEAGAAEEPISVLEWTFGSLGWFYSLVFGVLSFILVSLFVMNCLYARRDNVVPEQLIERFEEHLNERRYQEAYELARSDESFLGTVLAAGLGRMKEGYAQAIEAMQEVGEEENMKMQQRLSYMQLIGTISPMVGLFGTVHGMINSFHTIAVALGTPEHTKLAEGISKALFTTLIGLAIAIPAIAAYNILRNRVDRHVLEVGILSERLMSRFQNVGK